MIGERKTFFFISLKSIIFTNSKKVNAGHYLSENNKDNSWQCIIAYCIIGNIFNIANDSNSLQPSMTGNFRIIVFIYDLSM